MAVTGERREAAEARRKRRGKGKRLIFQGLEKRAPPFSKAWKTSRRPSLAYGDGRQGGRLKLVQQAEADGDVVVREVVPTAVLKDLAVIAQRVMAADVGADITREGFQPPMFV